MRFCVQFEFDLIGFVLPLSPLHIRVIREIRGSKSSVFLNWDTTMSIIYPTEQKKELAKA